MIENLNEHKQAKGAKLCVNIRCWSAKNSPKLSSKYLKDRMWKIKQYLNYTLMIINQTILAILRAFLNLWKKIYTKWTSTVATSEFVCKIPNRKKISNEYFKFCEAEISFDKIIKSINSKANNKSPG